MYHSSKVSVIIPIYRVEKYLARCLDSVVNQTYRELEIILVDDKGGDGSLDIAKSYRDKDSRIILIENEVNLGLAGARNAGLARATGKWVSFVDSDDFVALDLYEKVVERAEGVGAEVVSVDVLFCDGNQTAPYLMDMGKRDEFLIKDGKPTDFLAKSYKRLLPAAWSRLYLNDFLRANQIRFCQGLRYAEDLPFLVEILAYVRDFYYFGSLEPRYFYDRTALGSLSKSPDTSVEYLVLGLDEVARISQVPMSPEVRRIFDLYRGRALRGLFAHYISLFWYRKVFMLRYQPYTDIFKELDGYLALATQRFGFREPFIWHIRYNIFRAKVRFFIVELMDILPFTRL